VLHETRLDDMKKTHHSVMSFTGAALAVAALGPSAADAPANIRQAREVVVAIERR
jgi:hypothetical protein